MPLDLQIPIDTTASRSVIVTRNLTVRHHHDDLPEVYGTPMMIYLMEVAAAAALQPYLPAGWVSVGTQVEVRHLAATPVGFRVTATARVVEVGKKTVSFAVEAHDGVELIGQGTHVRAPIDLQRFENSMVAKTSAAET